MTKALAEFAGVNRTRLDPDLEEFADDFAADEEREGQFEFVVAIPRRWLAEAGDEPEAPPDEDGCYQCVFEVSELRDLPDEPDRWEVVVHSSVAQNRDGNLAVSTIAARVSVLLGGPDDPEPLEPAPSPQSLRHPPRRSPEGAGPAHAVLPSSRGAGCPGSRGAAMTALRWTTLVLCAAALLVLVPLWPPLVLAAWTAALTRPLLVRFERGLRGRRRAAAALSLLLFVLLAVPVTAVSVGVISGAQDLVTLIRTSPSALQALEALTSSPDTALHLPTTLSDALALAERLGAQGLGILTGVAGAAVRGLAGLLLYFAFSYALLLDGPAVWAWIERQAPLDPRHLRRLAAAFNETGRGLVVGVGLTCVTQGLFATLIYVALGVPRAWVLGPLTGLAGVIPLAGTSLIWAPVALGLWLTGREVRAVLLVALGLAVIAGIDNLLRPLFARVGSLRMPIVVLFAAMFGGLAAFGPWGPLLGPLVLRLAVEALDLAREERDAASARR